MPKFKDLMHAILNEDVEVEDEEMEEVVEPAAPQEEVKQEPVVETKTEEPVFVQPMIQPKAVKEEPVYVQEEKPAPRKPSIFDGMNADDIASEAPRPRKKKSGYHYDRSKLSKKNRLAEDLEYSPIISPIFGDIKEDKKEFNKVHNAIELQKPEEDFQYTQIISPMYGSNIPTPAPVEEIPTKTVVVENNEDVTLDEMLEKPKKENKKQKTLFEE